MKVPAGPFSVGWLLLISILVPSGSAPAVLDRLVLTATRCWAERGAGPPVVGAVDSHARCHDHVDPVQDVVREPQLCCAQLRPQLSRRGGAADRGRYRRVTEHERDSHFDEVDTRVVRQLRELFSGVELSLVVGRGQSKRLADGAVAAGPTSSAPLR